jgi:hypothetical protein
MPPLSTRAQKKSEKSSFLATGDARECTLSRSSSKARQRESKGKRLHYSTTTTTTTAVDGALSFSALRVAR